MRMYGEADVGGFGAHFDRERHFGDEIAGVRRDDATADDAVCRVVEDQFRETLGAADADRAPGCRVREFADAVLDALLLRFAFGDADPGDLRIGVGDRRHDASDEFTLYSGRDFGGYFCFMRSLVREHRLAD